MGLPGAGKSTLARALCARRNVLHVNRDELRARLFPRGPFDDGARIAASALSFGVARRALLRRRSVVLDGMTFATLAQRRRARALARSSGARCVEVFLDCPVELARQRVGADARHPARDRRPQLVDEVATRFARVAPLALRLKAEQPVQRLLRRLLKVLPP